MIPSGWLPSEIFAMADDSSVFQGPLEGTGSFEDLGQENGQRFWWQRDLMAHLGYTNTQSFAKAVGKAMAACTTLGIDVAQNFQHCDRTIDGELVPDCKLSRFACYLTAMNADTKKPEVAKAQAYFATLAEVTRQYLLRAENVERVLIRDEVTDASKAMVSAAKGAGVQNYAFFTNAGYLGLYNLSLKKLQLRKGVVGTLFDVMGKQELAANLFRITQTEAKIKKDAVRGQTALESTAHEVGRHVRNTIKQIGGTMPEDLPLAENIRVVRSGLKKTHKELQKMDKKKQLPAGKKKK